MDKDEIIVHRLRLESAFKAGANWFFWIAGLSLVNSIVAATGKEWGFVVGLGLTQAIDGIAKAAGAGSAGTAIALGLDLVVLAIVSLFGFLCRRGYTWAFFLGMTLYALDGIVFLLAGDWFGVIFHGLVLFFLFGGVSALQKLKALGPVPLGDGTSATAETAVPAEPVEPR
jgi:hypothetical protein